MTPSKMNKTRIVADTEIAVSLPANKSQHLLKHSQCIVSVKLTIKLKYFN